MDNIYYVYIYMDPRKPVKRTYDGLDFSFLYEPFYIGKGKGGRIESHMKDHINKKKKSHFYNKINKMLSIGIMPYIVKIYDNINEKDAFRIENHLIKTIGKHKNKTGPLLNITDGGEGVSGMKHTIESRKIMSQKTSGERHPNYGKHLKEETRHKISERLKLNNPMKNPDVVEKVVSKNRGKKPWNYGLKTEESVKKKMSEKKLKYYDIQLISKFDENLIYNFDTLYDVCDFLQKSYRSILNYIINGECNKYIIKYKKLNE